MRRNTKTRIVWIVVFLISLGTLAGRVCAPLKHSLPRVVDGDTIVVIYEGRQEYVRLLRIDTPERDQAGYEQSSRALKGLLKGREVVLEFEVPGKIERDKYDRLLAYVIADGVNLNIEMVRLGWSRFYTWFGKGKYAKQFLQAEAEAKQAGRGLWATQWKRN